MAPAPQAPPADETDPLANLLARIAHRVNRQIETILNRSGLTLEQWRVLDLLSDRQGRPMSEIAAAVMVPPPTLTKIVDRLVDNALVHRRVDEADRRRVVVLTSERGLELHGELAPAVTRVDQDLIAALGEQESRQLIELLRRLTAGQVVD